MNRLFAKFGLVIMLGGLIITRWPAHSLAVAETPKPRGLTVSPAIDLVSLPAGVDQKTIDFYLTNNETSTQNISVTTQDFNTLGETGGIVFAGSNPTELQKKYGLATWISLPNPSVNIPPGQTIDVKVTILNQASMAPGGHYGAIMFNLQTITAKNSNGNPVSLHSIASALLFVNKQGGDTHKLKLTDVNFSHNLFSLPSSVTTRFYNDGNTHVTPRGVVNITAPNGKIVSKGIINENSGLILPENYRLFSTQQVKLSNNFLPGKYTVTVAFRFDGVDQYRLYQSKYFMLPIASIAAITALLVIIILGWRIARRKSRH